MKIIKKNRQLITGLSTEQSKIIKESLTYDNPSYISAKKYSKSKYISIPPYINFYGTKNGGVEVPIGFDVEKLLGVKSEQVLDLRVSKKVDYPPFTLTLREDQQNAKDKYMNSVLNDTIPKSLIQLPTGKGKTILALNIAYTLGQKTLVLVHKDDLVTGWKKDIEECFGGKVISGLIKAKKRVIGDQITIATVQTLSRMAKEDLECYLDQFGLVIQDECLVGNTLVALEDGGVKPIKYIRNTERVVGGEVSNQFSRESEIYELQANNAIIKGSPTHPTWCVKKGKRHYSMNDLEYLPIKDINSDYYIPVLTKIPHTQQNDLSVEGAHFVAMDMCEGNLDPMSKLDKVLPMSLYYSPLESIKAFIETCFNCEGDLRVSNSEGITLNLYSVSEDFVQGINMLLKKFGIVAEIHRLSSSHKTFNTLYKLTVSGVFYNKFADTFKLIPPKTIPLRNHETQEEIFVGDYYLSPVKRVIPLGYKDTVYDFTVNSEEHSFIANGVYTHNCHHIGLKIFNILDSFNSKFKLGLTATPKRSDNLTFVFDLLLGGICYKHVYKKDDMDILPVKVILKESKAKYEPFVYDNQVFNIYDFKEEELPKNLVMLKDIPYDKRPKVPFLTVDNMLLNNNHYIIQVCKDIIHEYKQGHSCIAFFTQKDHIVKYYNYLSLFIPKETILLYYGDNKEKTETLMKKAESKECLVTLATYAKATEGTNVKSWEVGFLVSSLNNEKNVEQAVGRIRRSKEGKISKAILYDYRNTNSYSISNHGYTRDKVYSDLQFEIESHLPIKNKDKKGLFGRGFN